MNIALDQDTKQALKDMLQEKGKEAVRLVIKGFG